ncbi:hypothetical protein AMECASPLE_037625 [Ameca splendens]|uniref:Uncharacterized protein n=1 Tax=Ameca splendens TaxID=208324 RepID=A0ABV0ZUX8_9TELE
MPVESPKLCQTQVAFQNKFTWVISLSWGYIFTGKPFYCGDCLFSFLICERLVKGQQGMGPAASVKAQGGGPSGLEDPAWESQWSSLLLLDIHWLLSSLLFLLDSDLKSRKPVNFNRL